jgi:hypothetical protein
VHKHGIKPSIKEGIELFRQIGIFQFIKTMTRLVRYILSSKIIRDRIKKLEKGKIILTRKKSTSKHVGYVLGIGEKVG